MLTVEIIRQALEERAAIVRAVATQAMSVRGTTYSVEVRDFARARADGHDIALTDVQRELRAMESEGLVDSWLAQGPTLIRRYYRLVRPMRCPGCGEFHIDAGEWARRLHHTHLCLTCGHEWRLDEYVFGVAPRGSR